MQLTPFRFNRLVPWYRELYTGFSVLVKELQSYALEIAP